MDNIELEIQKHRKKKIPNFELRKDAATGYSYTQKKQLACYTSVVGQENVNNSYDSIYEYLQSLDNSDEVVKKTKQLYYTALGRERWGMYKIENPSDLVILLDEMQSINYEVPTPETPVVPEPPAPTPEVDNVGPTIEFSPNGNTESRSHHSAIVNVSDTGSGVNLIRYRWAYYTHTLGNPEDYVTISGAGIELPEDGKVEIDYTVGTGKWYLWVYAEDNKGNYTISRTASPFNLVSGE